MDVLIIDYLYPGTDIFRENPPNCIDLKNFNFLFVFLFLFYFFYIYTRNNDILNVHHFFLCSHSFCMFKIFSLFKHNADQIYEFV